MGSPQDGYWLIEPDELSPLIASPSLHPLAETILQWLAVEVTDRLRLDERLIRLEVIQAEYLGRYPCLGGRGSISKEDAAEIEGEVSRLLGRTPVSRFASFVAAQRLAS